MIPHGIRGIGFFCVMKYIFGVKIYAIENDLGDGIAQFSENKHGLQY